MPRQARLDAPGVLQHIMARGIERRKIFRDDNDRHSFLDRLALILEETQTQCYAWALISNHFHLLLRTGATPLSNVMRRLMTGYAVTFNRRHRRAGHLFQNRYKSVVCEEDPYLFELIRYIHLNPLRAGLVSDLKKLDKYLWSGHSAILGRRKNPLIPNKAKSDKRPARNSSDKGEQSMSEKTIEDVLLHFGNTVRTARRRYRQFVKNGIEQGRRPELQGGGLVRSAGGNKAGLLGRKKEEREKGDERILGSGDFVSEALRKAGEIREKNSSQRIPLAEVITKVGFYLDLEVKSILSSSRRKEVSEARSIISRLALEDMGYSASEVARALDISRVSVARCLERGKKVVDKYEELRDSMAR